MLITELRVLEVMCVGRGVNVREVPNDFRLVIPRDAVMDGRTASYLTSLEELPLGTQLVLYEYDPLADNFVLVVDRREERLRRSEALRIDFEPAWFEAQIANAPQDPQPRLVYADWLQARGDPFGELLVIVHMLRTHRGETVRQRVRKRFAALRAGHESRFMELLGLNRGEQRPLDNVSLSVALEAFSHANVGDTWGPRLRAPTGHDEVVARHLMESFLGQDARGNLATNFLRGTARLVVDPSITGWRLEPDTCFWCDVLCLPLIPMCRRCGAPTPGFRLMPQLGDFRDRQETA